MDEDRITAFHEAAHAVAAIRSGLVFDRVTALPDDLGETDGALHWSDLQASGDLDVSPELLAVVLLAGPCAEARVTQRDIEEVFTGEEAADDREGLAALMLDQDQFMTASVEALSLVERDWPIIERIAHELLEVDDLDYDQVAALVLARNH
jgi:hypothetical protein